MLIWIFLLGIIFSFIIPAVNFYLSEKNIAYIFYVLYILFSGVFVLFTFVKYNDLILFSSDFIFMHDYERIFNSVPAVFYYLFLWFYVAKSDNTKTYRRVLNSLLFLTVTLAPIITLLDIYKFEFINEKLITSIVGVIVLVLTFTLSILLIKDKNKAFKFIGFGFLTFSILVIVSLTMFSMSNNNSYVENPHIFYLIGIILELTLLNYALNLSNLDYREKLILENNQLEGLALRSQMNPHFVHNSLNVV